MLFFFFGSLLLCLEMTWQESIPIDSLTGRRLSAKVPNFTNPQRKYQREMLQAHNIYRKRHCAPVLRLNDRLSRSAQNYAEQLARMNTMVHSGIKGLGENLYVRRSSRKIDQIEGITATQAWYDEIKFYNFNQPKFSAETGHFTQVIWKNSQQLGVGLAYTNDQRSVYVVAQYTPPGNVLNVFQSNVLPTNCTSFL